MWGTVLCRETRGPQRDLLFLLWVHRLVPFWQWAASRTGYIPRKFHAASTPPYHRAAVRVLIRLHNKSSHLPESRTHGESRSERISRSPRWPLARSREKTPSLAWLWFDRPAGTLRRDAGYPQAQTQPRRGRTLSARRRNHQGSYRPPGGH